MKEFKLFIILILLSVKILGQQVEISVPDPNAVSLMTPVEIPASHYRGVPNINIPLYTVKYKNFSIPISIAYQASGIQVAQESSCIGLGWSLNAGGSISRVIRGYNDFQGGDLNGYTNGTYPVESNCYFGPYSNIINGPIPPDFYARPYFCDNNFLSELFEIHSICNIDGKDIIEQDMEPDIFTYSFCGYSGKFFMKDEKEFVFIDNNNNLKIIDSGEMGFIIQDANGVRYKFWQGTKSRSYSQPSKTKILNPEMVIDGYGGGFLTDEGDADVSTWNLETIILPRGDTINFEYIYNEAYKSHVRASQIQVINLDAPEAIKFRDHLDELLCYAPGTGYNYNYSFQIYDNEKVLKRITFGNNTVEFEHGQRKDLKNFWNTTEYQERISGFQVKNQEKTIRKVVFYNDAYFNENSNETYKELYLRLKLDSIKINDQPVYEFKYNNQNSLPKKNSPSFDHWGYYNNKENIDDDGKDEIQAFLELNPSNRLNDFQYADGVTSVTFNTYNDVSISLDGADRTVDINYTQTAILEEIKYPTGGSRKFKYGVNQYYDGHAYYVFSDTIINSLVNINTIGETETPFTISSEQTIVFSGGVLVPMIKGPNYPDYDDHPFIYAEIWNLNTQQREAYLTHWGSDNETLSVFLSTGDYVLKTYGDGHNGYGPQLGYFYISGIEAKQDGGGLRIERIEDSNGETRLFDYKLDNGYSSGILLSQPEYVNFYYSGIECDCNGPDTTYFTDDPDYGYVPWDMVISAQRHSSSIRPIVGSNGASVGYSRVKEMLISENSDTSLTTHYFKSEPEKYRSYMLANLPNVAVLSNGLLDSIEYKKNSDLVRKEVYSYEKDINHNYTHYACRQDIETYNMMFYKNSNQWWKLKTKETIDYFPDGNVNTTELFDYNINNFQVNKHTTYNDEQQVVKKEIKYPTDYDLSGVGANDDVEVRALKLMVDSFNMITKPIEQITFMNNKVVGASLSTYGISNGLVYPFKTYKLESNLPLLLDNDEDTEDYYNFSQVKWQNNRWEFIEDNHYPDDDAPNFWYHWDEYGNCVQIDKRYDNSTYYIWGYDETKPIVKIENFKSSDIPEIEQLISNVKTASDNDIDIATENTLRNDLNALRNELTDFIVTCYTYDHLIGLTSQIDPNGKVTYYNYDEFGRLKNITDDDGKRIKEFQYAIQDEYISTPGTLTIDQVENDHIAISWPSVPGAESYTVYRSTSNLQFTEIANVSQNTFEDHSVQANTNYFYKVKSQKGILISEFSNSLEVRTKRNPPAIPSNVSGTVNSNTSITISWTDVSYDEGYKIYRSTSSAGTYTQIGTVGTGVTSYPDDGLNSNTTYYYKVRAYNSDYASDYSSYIAPKTKKNPPAIPSNVSGTVNSNTSITISWTDVNYEEGYKIYRSTSSTGTYSLAATIGAGVTSYSNTGLSGNTSYYYKVEAFNSDYSSGLSTHCTAETKKNPPAIPNNVSSTVNSNTSITISWIDVSYDEGYKIYRSTSSTGTYTQIGTVGTGVTSYPDDGLNSNTTYYYKVRAYNSDYASDYSSYIAPKTKKNPPAIPNNVSGTVNSNTSITISWTDVSYDEGYKIYRSTSSAGTYTQIGTVGTGVTSYSNTGLSGNTSYYYKVRAYNSDYASDYSSYIAPKTKLNPPTTPSMLSATVSSNTQINLTWSNVSGESGYYIYQSTSASTGYVNIATVGAGVTSYSSAGLSGNTKYYYKVRAYNSDYPSAYSSYKYATTKLNPPAAPLMNSAAASSNTQISLIWSNVLGESGYYIYRSTSASTGYALIATLGTGVTMYSDLSLNGNTTYYYKVRSYNVDYPSDYSNYKSAKTKLNPPPTPTMNSATVSSNTQINLTWSNVSGESGYYIYRSTSASTGYVHIATVGAGVTSYSSAGLSGNTTYYYKVRSYNSDYPSAYSNYKAAKTKLNPPPTPTMSSATPSSNTQINLTWSNVSGESGYYIYRSTNASSGYSHIASVGSGVTSYSSTGLSSNTTYYYKVRSYNSDYPSAYSNYKYAKTKLNPPGTPSVSLSSSSTSSIVVSWNNVAEESGYRVYKGNSSPDISGSNINILIATLSAGVTSYTNTGLLAGTTYYYKVTAYNSDYSSTSLVRSKQTLCVAPSSINGTTLNLCKGSVESYTCSSVTGASSYTWVVPSGWTIQSGQGSRTISVLVGTSGGTLKVRTNNPTGSSSYKSVSTSIIPLPSGTISISGPSLVDNGDHVYFSISPVSGATSYQWTVPTGATILNGQGTTSIAVLWGNYYGDVKVESENCSGVGPVGTKRVLVGFEIAPGGGFGF